MKQPAPVEDSVVVSDVPRRRRAPWSVLLAGFVILLGVAVMLYPSAASWLSSIQQVQQGDRYTQIVAALGPADRQARLDEARKYNSQLSAGKILDPFSNLEAANTETDDPYWKLLLGTPEGVMARIRIPAIGVDLPIFHGTSDQKLKLGVGHLRGTSLPIGGAGTHAVLTGHRGLPEAMLFTRVNELKSGDLIMIEVYGETLTYRVTTNDVVLPTETETLKPEAGRDLVTLVTCTPIGINSHRILVTAERVAPTTAALVKPDTARTPVAFPWWAVIFGGSVVVVTAGVIVASRRQPTAVRARRGQK